MKSQDNLLEINSRRTTISYNIGEVRLLADSNQNYKLLVKNEQILSDSYFQLF